MTSLATIEKPANKLVDMKNNEAVTSSLQISKSFGKGHRHVLSVIDELKKGLPKNTQTYFKKQLMCIRRINKLIDKSL